MAYLPLQAATSPEDALEKLYERRAIVNRLINDLEDYATLRGCLRHPLGQAPGALSSERRLAS